MNAITTILLLNYLQQRQPTAQPVFAWAAIPAIAGIIASAASATSTVGYAAKEIHEYHTNRRQIKPYRYRKNKKYRRRY